MTQFVFQTLAGGIAVVQATCLYKAMEQLPEAWKEKEFKPVCEDDFTNMLEVSNELK